MSCLITMSQKELHRLELIQKIRDERLTVVEAAERLNLSRSQVHRLLQVYDLDGAAGLVSKKRSRPSNRRHSEGFRNAARDLIRERYMDFGPTLAREVDRAAPDLGREGDAAAMTEAGIWVSCRERKSGFSSHAADAIALVSWCRSMGRITGGSRTESPMRPRLYP